ncbi:hypothetical protein GWR56_15475 [Mucilaginibacter sp. 14171R-50]|uniref:hypothetical protein n=1 Tax=Mucilaginibacter sp. 14171R-50 TaxID=2703789 RepID=UPI00138D972A|nr:hypothetical protein [Mucilaginibacter sp. 14171R-50]QHS56876.1 hypothetical protein GWR56_15475 [Mucilaginibacter sp. 14171R-50]
MKKQLLAAAICACLAFAACSGSSKQGTTDSSAVSQDSTGSGGAATGADSSGTIPPNASASSAGTAAGDTARAKQDTANTTPQR